MFVSLVGIVVFGILVLKILGELFLVIVVKGEGIEKIIIILQELDKDEQKSEEKMQKFEITIEVESSTNVSGLVQLISKQSVSLGKIKEVYVNGSPVPNWKGFSIEGSKMYTIRIVFMERITDIMGMFCGCSNLESLDLSGLDTSNVTDMT